MNIIFMLFCITKDGLTTTNPARALYRRRNGKNCNCSKCLGLFAGVFLSTNIIFLCLKINVSRPGANFWYKGGQHAVAEEKSMRPGPTGNNAASSNNLNFWIPIKDMPGTVLILPQSYLDPFSWKQINLLHNNENNNRWISPFKILISPYIKYTRYDLRNHWFNSTFKHLLVQSSICQTYINKLTFFIYVFWRFLLTSFFDVYVWRKHYFSDLILNHFYILYLHTWNLAYIEISSGFTIWMKFQRHFWRK